MTDFFLLITQKTFLNKRAIRLFIIKKIECVFNFFIKENLYKHQFLTKLLLKKKSIYIKILILVIFS